MSQDEIVVDVSGLAYGGASIGSIVRGPDRLAGKKALVRYTVPGEKVGCAVDKDEKRIVHASLRNILEPSTNRESPPCPKFKFCGGCDLQHMNITLQREEKLRMVVSTLKAKGGIESLTPAELLGASLPAYRYRRKISLHLSRDGRLGFYRQGTGDVVDLDDCLLASDVLSRAFKSLKPFSKSMAPYAAKLTLEEAQTSVVLIVELREDSERNDWRRPEMQEISNEFPAIIFLQNGKELYRSAALASDIGYFSQVNAEANEILIEKVSELITESKVTDLFAGAGNLSIPLAQLGKSVDAVEVNASLVKAGQEKASRLGLSSKLEFHHTSCEKYIKNKALQKCILLDPPRSGAKDVVERFSPTGVRKVIYVSCNLPTLVRDIALLQSQNFRLTRLFVLDMFPQTHHVETISELTAA